VLLSVSPALAKLSVTFINRTGFEIQAIKMTGDGGSMTSAIRVVPDNFCVFGDGTSSELEGVVIDVGMMLFAFTDTKAVSGMSDPTFELSFDADERPHLTLVDKPGQTIPSLINLVGKATLLADASIPNIADFHDILRAETMGDLRNMGARDATMWDSQLHLPAKFLGKTWAVFVESSKAFTRNDADKAGNRTLRTYTGGPEGVRELMQGLAAEGYRPWFAQLTAGEDMDTEAVLKFWEEDLEAEEAWEQVVDASEQINQEGKPAAVDTILLTEEGYAKAAKGEDAAVPGFRLRVSNAAVITLQYMPDISMLIAMTR
jgi:hypothetical protein